MAETLQSIREGEEIPKEIEKEKAALSTQKTRILDDEIFQAIADIAFFFNVIGTHPEIQHEFDDDIQELLGVRRKLPETYDENYGDKSNNPKIPSYGFIFLALVEGILSIHSGRPGIDFRLRLTHELQRIIWYKISHYLLGVLGSRKRPC